MENSRPIGFNLPELPKPLPGYPQLETNSVYAPFEHPPVVDDDSFKQRIVNFFTSPKVNDVIIGVILLVLLIPSTMALASWNAVPGDLTYPWKISLEKSLLFVLKPSKELSGSTQVAITQRRFSEATDMLSGSQAELGLTNLTDQIATTSLSIHDINSRSARKELADKYIADLIEVNKRLEKEKLARRAKQKNSPVAGVGGNQNPNPTQASGGSPNPPSPPTVEDDIDTAQQVIEDTIDDLTTIQNQVAPAPTPTPTIEPTTPPTPTTQPTSQPSLSPTLAFAAPTASVAENPDQDRRRDIGVLPVQEATPVPDNTPVPEPTTPPAETPAPTSSSEP